MQKEKIIKTLAKKVDFNELLNVVKKLTIKNRAYTKNKIIACMYKLNANNYKKYFVKRFNNNRYIIKVIY